MNKEISSILAIALLFCLATVEIEARGGRGRGGGSFGGIFGGLRKYKKPASSSNSRRITNGSPMHTPLTVSGFASSAGSSSSSMKMSKQSKAQSSYPKQQMPKSGPGISGYAGHTGGFYSGGGYGAGNSLPQGTYYTNTAALPPGAVYYAQPPMRTGHGDFLFGMLSGHLMSSALFGNRHHVTHVYQQSEPSAEAKNNDKIIIINNEDSMANETDNQQEYWPTENEDTLLARFNDTVTASEMVATESSSGETAATTQQPMIVCFPIMLNETDPADANLVKEVEKTICFPAPTPIDIQPNCVIRTFIESDPSDPKKSIEVERQVCEDTSTTEPPIVAGEILDHTGTQNATEVSS